MNIDPKKIEPGFIVRWGKQSIALFLGAPICWTIVLLALWGLGETKINSIIGLLVGMFLIILGLEISHYSYEKNKSINSVTEIVKGSFTSWLLQINLRIYFLMFMIAISLFFDLQVDFLKNEITIENAKKVTDKDIMFFSKSFWVMAYGLVAISGYGMLSIFTHLYFKFFTIVDKDVMSILSRKAALINKELLIINEIVVLVVILLISRIAPYLMIGIYPLYCGMVYLAFREIFLNDKVKVTEEKKVEDVNLLPNI